MLRNKIKGSAAGVLASALAFIMVAAPLPRTMAADHAESISVAADPGADIGDTYAFLSPVDNTKVVLALDVEGFIVPSELTNLSFFPSDILYRFEIENTGDTIPDAAVDVTFSAQTSRTAPQTATIKIRNGTAIRERVFTAPTTVQTLNPTPNPFVVTTDSVSGARFFAGLTDDPFYFDIVGFNRFAASVLGGTPDPTRLQRQRDSFAGYNIHMIAIEIPATMLRGSAGNTIGVNGVTLRRGGAGSTGASAAQARVENPFNVQVDRMATPAVNTVLIPFPRKNEYNQSTPRDDANGRFATDIVATLTALGTNSTNIGLLAGVAVTNGDYLRLNTATPNPSLGFGERITTPGYVGFPNGRRPGDDTIDTVIYFVTNQAILQGDNVNSNEKPLGAAFPFFATPHQPLENPTVDPTQN